ncbi:MAG: polysaccharide biosynthesis/export family protein [Acidobacteria bacterium]|nr:polysaccharide biosynthesis/export family protein [Acidobacteriota bacterium]
MKILVAAFFILLLNTSVVLSNQAPSSPAPDVPEAFVIGLEDVLSVGVWKEPDLSVKEVVVRPDGKISLPLISDIQASGLTPKQLQDRIAEKLKEFVASPTVTVSVLKIASQSVSIVGQVARPGSYFLGSPMTVLELLARAGGFREEANAKKIAIVRKENGKTSYFSFNYKEVSKGRNLQQNIVLKNGDVVIVP